MRSPKQGLESRSAPYLLIAPFYLLFAAFGLFPLAYTLWVSLHRWDLLGGATSGGFVGLENYARLLGDAYFWNAVGNTAAIWVLSTVPQMVAALGLAAVLNTRLRARTFFRMGVLLPNVTSVTAVAIIFAQIFGAEFGLANYLLDLVGLDSINWSAGSLTSYLAISAMVIWRWTGYSALIYLAAMQAIPRELYEASALDGASRFRQFVHVEIPMLRPTIIFTVIVSTIGGFQLFAEPLLFDPSPGSVTGGSDRQFQTLAVYLYEQAFRNFQMGYGAAIAWALFLLILVASLVNFVLVRRIRSAE